MGYCDSYGGQCLVSDTLFPTVIWENDSLFDIVTELQKETQIPIDASCEEVIGQLQERLRDKQVKSRLGKLTTYVPYCFLYPWINATNNSREVMWRSQSFENGCLYSIYKEKTNFISNLIRCGMNICIRITRF